MLGLVESMSGSWLVKLYGTESVENRPAERLNKSFIESVMDFLKRNNLNVPQAIRGS